MCNSGQAVDIIRYHLVCLSSYDGKIFQITNKRLFLNHLYLFSFSFKERFTISFMCHKS